MRERFEGIHPDSFAHPADRAALQTLRAVPGIDLFLKALHGSIAERAMHASRSTGAVQAIIAHEIGHIACDHNVALILLAASPIPYFSVGLLAMVVVLDVVVMFAFPDNQRIGDYISGTQVVPVK